MRAAIALGLALLGCEPAPAGRIARPFTVVEGGTKHFAFAYQAGEKAGVFYSEHPDDYVRDPIDAAVQVAGAGAVTAAVHASNFYVSGVAAISGMLYGASYITAELDQGSERVHGWISTDGGVSWKRQEGTLRLPQRPKPRKAGWGGLLIHRRLGEYDGAIAGTMYGNYATDGEWYRSVWAKSQDMGKTWEVVSTIAQGMAGSEGYGEPVSARCEDGRILVVMRTGPNSNMRQSRSRDGGLSWEAAQELAGRPGWDPDLLASEGGLVMSYGLPGKIWIATSRDCGESWTTRQEIALDTTSGYTALARISGQLVMFTDDKSESRIVCYPVEVRP